MTCTTESRLVQCHRIRHGQGVFLKAKEAQLHTVLRDTQVKVHCARQLVLVSCSDILIWSGTFDTAVARRHTHGEVNLYDGLVCRLPEPYF